MENLSPEDILFKNGFFKQKKVNDYEGFLYVNEIGPDTFTVYIGRNTISGQIHINENGDGEPATKELFNIYPSPSAEELDTLIKQALVEVP